MSGLARRPVSYVRKSPAFSIASVARLGEASGAAWVGHAGGRYDYLYSEAELTELEPKIRQVAARAKKTFVIFNNHKDGKAFANAVQMKARLSAATKLRAPAALVQRYPALRDCATPDGDEQLPLV